MCVPNIYSLCPHFKVKYAKDFTDQLLLSEFVFYYNISFLEIHIILKKVKISIA